MSSLLTLLVGFADAIKLELVPCLCKRDMAFQKESCLGLARCLGNRHILPNAFLLCSSFLYVQAYFFVDFDHI